MVAEHGHTLTDQSLDRDFYLQSYPIVARELSRGVASSALEHYKKIGRSRGYLASTLAARYYDTDATASPFGGLWTDHTNAPEILQHKLDSREITPGQAQQLTDWMRDGLYPAEEFSTSLISFGTYRYTNLSL